MDSPSKSNKFMLIMIIHLCTAPYFISQIPFLQLAKSPFLILIFTPLYCFLIPLIIYTVITSQSLKAIIPFKKLSIKNIILIFFISLIIQPIIMVISAATNIFFNNDVYDVLIELSDMSFWKMLLTTAVAPAICEELIFRGVLLTGYKNSGLLKSSLITGLFFGMMHLNPYQFFYAFAIGVFFVYLIHYTGSIFSTILSHFVINGTQVCLLYLYNSESMKNSEILSQDITIAEKISAFYSSIFFSLFFIPFFILLFLIFISVNKNNDSKYIHNEKLESNINSKFFTIPFIVAILIYVSYMLELYIFI